VFSNPFTRTTFEDVMKDFGGSGLGVDFLDNIFGDILKGRGSSFRVFRQGFGDTSGTLTLKKSLAVLKHPCIRRLAMK